jgi:hypothetical protein
MAKLNDKLAALATMSPVQLRDEWLRAYRTPAPYLTPDMLVRGIAYRLQEKALGALPTATLRKLNSISAGGEPNAAPSAATIRPGTRLIRAWHGRTIEAIVLEEGYLFDDQFYPSLTAIARAVTGVAWSGPRFFGLKSNG